MKSPRACFKNVLKRVAADARRLLLFRISEAEFRGFNGASSRRLLRFFGHAPRLLAIIGFWFTLSALAGDSPRALRFQARSAEAARAWQQAARDKLFALMMGGRQPARVPLEVKVLRRLEYPEAGAVLEELTLQSLPDRRAHAWLARPVAPKGKVGAVLAINGHGGSGEQVVRGSSLYWYGRALIEMGYVVIAPDVGQHELQHTNWTLMGERTWDALRCLDYAVTLP
jgi:hypothetical protein